MSQISWEARVSAFVAEASLGLKDIAGPLRDGDRIKARIARAARACGLTYWRAFDLWYGKARRIEAHEIEAIRAARAARANRRSDDLAALAVDFEALAERVSRLVTRTDRQEVDAFRSLALRARGLAAGE